MSQMSDYLEQQLRNHIFRTASFSKPSALYVALYTGAPTDAGGGTGVAGNAYARAQCNPADANWAEGTSTDGVVSNAVAINFPTPTAAWGTVTHFSIFDASTGGNMLAWGALNQSRSINTGDTVSFPIGNLTFTFQ